jgi:hypothetical protein
VHTRTGLTQLVRRVLLFFVDLFWIYPESPVYYRPPAPKPAKPTKAGPITHASIVEPLTFKVGDSVIERVAGQGAMAEEQTEIVYRDFDTVRTKTGRTYDALTGASAERVPLSTYHAIHSIEYRGKGIRQ